MADAPFPFNDFSGLDLRSEADESSCIDLLNVDLDKHGAVRSRSGYTKFNAIANPASFAGGAFVWPEKQWILGGTGFGDKKVYVYGNDGVLKYTSAAYANTGEVFAAVPYGTGTTSYLYFAIGDYAVTIQRLDAAGAFSSPAGMPAASCLAVQPAENRLVAANTASNQLSRVKFSDPGAPETWGANNFVDLDPNDGELIDGLVVWRDLLFAFKQSKFYVFYGNSQDALGQPIFNYRTINTGIGGRSPVAGPDGVYFIGQRGIFRTTGGPPVKVSMPIDPLFTGEAIPFSTLVPPLGYRLGPTADYHPASGAMNDRVYFIARDNAGAGTQYVFVYDTVGGYWLVWQLAASLQGSFCVMPVSDVDYRLAFVGGTRIYTQRPSDTTDDGTAITSRWRSGYFNLNYIIRQRHWYPISDQEATLRESVLDGTGTINFSVARDWAVALPTSGGGAKAQVTLGVAPAVAQGRHTKAQRGRALSFQIEDVSGGPWKVEDVVLHLTGVRALGMKTT